MGILLEKNKRFIKKIVTSSLILFALIIGFSFNNDKVQGLVVQDEATSSIQPKPAHSFPYKLGMEDDIESSLLNSESLKKLAYKNRAKELEAIKLAADQDRIEAIKEAKELAEKLIVKKEKQIAENQAKEKQENLQETSQNVAQATQAKPASNNQQEVKSSQSSSQPAANTEAKPASTQQAAPAQQPASAPKPQAPAPKPQQPAPAPKPKAPQYASNQIGINGIFVPFTNYGRASTDQLQSGIDAGLIVAGFTHFNGNDGETTYFGGHNPGIMRFMENNIYIGATVTVTDANGTPHNYRMIDKVDVDPYGEGRLNTIGRSAIDVYTYGTSTESILVQFCNTSNNLMSFWYGVKY